MPFGNYNEFDPSAYPDGAANDPRAPYNEEPPGASERRMELARQRVWPRRQGVAQPLPPSVVQEPLPPDTRTREEKQAAFAETLAAIERSFRRPAPKRPGA